MGAVLAAKRDVVALVAARPRLITGRPEVVNEGQSDPARNGPQHALTRIQAISLETALTQVQDTGNQPAEKRLELALTFPAGPNLSEEDRAEGERRYRIIEPLLNPERFESVWVQNGRQRSKVIASLAGEHGLSRRTIYAWLKAFELGGLAGLVRKGRSDKGFSRRFDGAALEFILSAALPRPGVYGELSAREIFRAYNEEREWRAGHSEKPLTGPDLLKYARYVTPETGCLSGSAQLPQASYETFRVWFNRIPEPVKTFARQGEDSFHDTQEILSYRDLAALRPLDFIVLDHRQLDVFCLIRSRDGWQLARPWITAAIDMKTRKWLGSVIVQVPSSDSIASVLKSVFLEFGVPNALYFDNGRDFRSEWIEGKHRKTGMAQRIARLGDGTCGILDALGVRVVHSIIRRARSKIIEANFLNVANFERTLPYWCGNKPTARPARFDALIEQHKKWLAGETKTPAFPTIQEISALYNDFLTALNEREHSGEGMEKITPTGRGWMCPNEAWERLIGKVERRVVSAELLQFCFHKRRQLTVRHSEIRVCFDGRAYHYRLLDSPIRLMELNGCAVQFSYDPLDLGMGVLYYEDRLVGLVSCIELRRMGEAAFVADERERRGARRMVKNLISAVHQQIYTPGPAERLARRLAVQPARIEPARVEVPAELPAAIVAGAEAARQLQAPAEEVEIKRTSVGSDDGDEGAFVFFSQKGAS